MITSAAQFTSIHMGSSMYADVRAVHGSAQIRKISVTSGVNVHIETMLTLEGVTWQVGEA